MDKILLIGRGKWGQNYISTLQSSFPNVNLTIANRRNWKGLIDQGQDGVIICTPPQSHIEIAHYSLASNVPTLIEKPLSLSLQEAQQLQQYNTTILVNHIHLFSDRYQAIKHQVKDITHIFSQGSSNSPPRDYSRLWDYGPHEIALILDLTQQYPHTINCTQDQNDQYTITMQFDTFQSSSIVGYSEERQRYLDINDGEFIYDGMIKELPLTNAIQVFLNAIHGKPDYRLGLQLSLDVIRVLEQCQESVER
jgi:hypothetical protein